LRNGTLPIASHTSDSTCVTSGFFDITVTDEKQLVALQGGYHVLAEMSS